MTMTNSVTLLGNLGTAVETRYTQAGQPVANFRLATNEIFAKNGEKQVHTEWHRVVIWGKLAETCAAHLRKGQQVMLTGRLRTRQWTDKEGATRYTTEVHANQVQFLQRPKAKISTETVESMVESVEEKVAQEAVMISDAPF
jgi:single-strand DNA-binding protein